MVSCPSRPRFPCLAAGRVRRGEQAGGEVDAATAAVEAKRSRASGRSAGAELAVARKAAPLFPGPVTPLLRENMYYVPNGGELSREGSPGQRLDHAWRALKRGERSIKKPTNPYFTAIVLCPPNMPARRRCEQTIRATASSVSKENPGTTTPPRRLPVAPPTRRRTPATR